MQREERFVIYDLGFNNLSLMKTYLKPVIETIQVQSADCFMQLAGSGDHGTQAPARAKKLF
jgi:hypothetical protein